MWQGSQEGSLRRACPGVTCTGSEEAPLDPRPEFPAVKLWHHSGPHGELRQARGRSPRARMARGARVAESPGKPDQGPGRQASGGGSTGRRDEDAAGQPQRLPTASGFRSSGLRSPLLAGPAARSQVSSGPRVSICPSCPFPQPQLFQKTPCTRPPLGPSFWANFALCANLRLLNNSTQVWRCSDDRSDREECHNLWEPSTAPAHPQVPVLLLNSPPPILKARSALA